MSEKIKNDLVVSMREKLIEYISKKEMSQRGVAKELNISETTLSLFLKDSYSGNNLELAKIIQQYINLGTAREALAKLPELCLKVNNTVEIERKARIVYLSIENSPIL